MTRGRFYADIFDANGKFYVFDDSTGGAECAGPFDTFEEAEKHADAWNNPLTSNPITGKPTAQYFINERGETEQR